jgi:hypothetical protein
MKRFLTFVAIAALGVFTIGCESQKGTTENKTETTTTQSKDGKMTGETTNATDTKTTQAKDGKITSETTTSTGTTKTALPVTPTSGSKATEKTTETTK